MRTSRRRGPFAALILALCALLLGVPAQAGATVPAAAPAPFAVPSDGGTYQLAMAGNGRCLDVPGASTASGAKIQLWGCTPDSPWQDFRLVGVGSGQYHLVNASSGKCADVTDWSTDSGAAVQQWGCDGAQGNQRWSLTASTGGTYQVVNAHSRLCLSAQNPSAGNGTAITQQPCTTDASRRWTFVPVGSADWSDTPEGFASTNGGTTGGAAGSTVTVTTLADLQRYASASQPHVIRVAAAINVNPKGHEIRVASNKTIVGVGTQGQIVGGGFFLDGVSNVIIRNLTIRDTRMADDDPGDDAYDFDGIQMDGANRVWIDHNRIERMNDGLIDSREDTTNLTVSWNILNEGNKSFGIGWTENVTARITIHHNWIRNTNSRNPSTDNVAMAHFYNNWLQDTRSGNWSRGATRAVIENSYYERVRDPYYRDATAALTQRGSILVDTSGRRETGGTTFDPRAQYAYTLHPAADVPGLLRSGAGPQASIGT
ncbi:RICIN domain-containing protein [Streptomyces marincola]|uniref:RICIN domain-containing protein n=1 Tax=Streptomyces marincola TaxID=2878388 RepID=UPI001CF14128|nr:RICIN domain-containing protein [Streptomyces marincola]UCM90490.1 RICIN domain-containing protein [Streptomyces marincola]